MTASFEFIQGAELAQAREPEGSTNNEIGLRILLVGQGGFRPFCRVKPSSEIFPLWGDEVKRESGKLEPPSPRPAPALARCVSAGIAAGTEVGMCQGHAVLADGHGASRRGIGRAALFSGS